jgi:hypothetical protein
MQEILPKEANPHTAEHKKQKFTCPNKVGLIENCRPIQTIELGSNKIVGFDTLTGDKILALW